MPQIYVHPFYSMSAHPTEHRTFQNIQELPDHCDMIAAAYFHRNVEQITPELEILSRKTQNLLVYLEEFNNADLFDVLADPRWQHCKFFYNMVPTHAPLNHQTVISWTCSGHNVYADQWAQILLSRLNKGTNPYKKRFDCLLGRQRPHRDFVEQCYNQSQFQDQIIFTYYKQDQNIAQGLWAEDLHNYDISPQIVIPVDIYNQSYYSIIAETDANYSNFSFYTEKTAKPIVAKRLFVFFASKNYLKNLRKLGFQTFDSVIDESYDQIDDDVERWTQAWAQVESLCARDVEQVLDQIQPIVQHNYDHFMRTDWRAGVKQEFEKLRNVVNK